jgi:hypothetical protein
MYELLPKNLSIKTYWADLTKPDKPVSKDTKLATLKACRSFLERLNKAITATAIDELVEFKRTHPDNTTLGQKLKLWKAEAPRREGADLNIPKIELNCRVGFTACGIRIYTLALTLP